MVEDQEPVINTAPQTSGPPEGSGTGALNPAPTPIETNREDFQSGNQEQGIKPSRWDSLMTSVQQAWESGTTSTVLGYANQKVAEAMDQSILGITKISPEDANKRFPGMPEPFTTPIDPNVAQIQYDNFKHRQHLQEWAIRGGADPANDFWGPIPTSRHGAQDFIAGVATGFADPINLAAGLATGGIGELAGVTRSLRNVLIQNLAINAGLGAIDYGIQKSEHLAPSAEDTAKGALFSALGGTLFHMGISKIWPVDIQEKAIRTSIMQHEAGATIDVTPQAVEARARMAGEMNGEASPYRFTPVGHPSERTYFMAQREGQSVPFHDFGPGTYAIDDGVAANNLAAANDGKGLVGEHTPAADSKFVDLSEPLPKELIDQAKAEFDKAGVGDLISRRELENMPGQSVLQSIMGLPEQDDYNAGEVFRERMKGEGYDGIKYVASDENGNPVHNGVVMFDEAKAKPNNVYQSNPELVPTVSDDSARAFAESSTSPQSAATYSPEIEKTIRDYKHQESLNSTPEYMDPIVTDQYQQAKSQLQKLSETSESAKEALKQLQRSEANGKQELEMMKQIADCVSGGVA